MFTALKRYADFSGRASLAEFWLFFLFQFLVLSSIWGLALLLGVIFDQLEGFAIGALILHALFEIAMLIPNLAVDVRRFHDQGRSGALLLLVFIPYVGGLIFLIFMLMPSQPYDNQYGPY
ncbi:MAG: DUF805 domain-containing protein [Lentisphaeria bacterium]|nr:DUF805 domain-containing protein [Lentisphaeria bacterium]